jgi:hypothetical protein
MLVRVTTVALVIVLVVDLLALGGKSLSSDSSRPGVRAGGDRSKVATGAPGVNGPGVSSASASGASTASASAGGATGTGGGGTGTGGGIVLGGDPGSPTGPRSPLTASDRGVTETTVKVVFPWFDISAYTSASGTTTDEPIEGGPDAISAFVDYVNANGGLDGRTILPQIEDFNPLNETDMQERCRRWAEDDKVFAVVDSSAWHSDHQLCVTQDHQTPLLSQLALSEEWPKRGAPYLWWTAPTTEETVTDWVIWAVQTGRLTKDHKIGVVTGVKEEERLGKAAIERALGNAGIDTSTVDFAEIPGYTADIGLAQPAIAAAVSRMKGEGVDRLMMGLSALVFTSWMNQADAQEFFPLYLLSDFNNTVTTAEALNADQHGKSLKGAIGPTNIRLGEVAPEKGGSYAPAQQRCNDIWRAALPNAKNMDGSGVAMRWCDNIFLFTEAARRATRANDGVLTRLNWTEAMASIQNVEAGLTPNLSYGPGDYSGATMTKVVELHTDEEAFCTARGTTTTSHCNVEVEPYQPMRHF